jgi:tetratricopeptide (TPR) repeat protein
VKGKRVILLLDDLNEYSGIDVQVMYQQMAAQAKSIAVAASCREGEELRLLESGSRSFARFYEEIRWKFSLLPPSDRELSNLAFHVGTDWTPKIKSARLPIGSIAMANFFETTRSHLASLSPELTQLMHALICLSWMGCPVTHDRSARAFEALYGRPLSDISRQLGRLAEGAFIYQPSLQDPVLVRPEYALIPESSPEDLDLFASYVRCLVPVMDSPSDVEGLWACASTLARIGDDVQASRLLLKASTLASRLDPPWTVVILGKAIFFLTRGRFPEAVRAFEELTRIEGDNASLSRAWHNLASCRLMMKQYKSAINNLRESLRYRPDNLLSLIMMGNCQLHLEQYDAALASFDRSLRLVETVDAWNGKARAFEKMHRLDSALDCFVEASRLDQRDYAARAGEGRILYNLKRYQEARSPLNAAIDADPEDGMSHMLLAIALRESGGRRQGALQLSARAVELMPREVMAWRTYTGLLRRVGQYEESLLAIERMKEHVGERPEYWVEKAHVLAHAPDRLNRDGGKVALDTACKAWRLKAQLSEEDRRMVVHSMQLLGRSVDDCPRSSGRQSKHGQKQSTRH